MQPLQQQHTLDRGLVQQLYGTRPAPVRESAPLALRAGTAGASFSTAGCVRPPYQHDQAAAPTGHLHPLEGQLA